jgi:hypothetical protein
MPRLNVFRSDVIEAVNAFYSCMCSKIGTWFNLLVRTSVLRLRDTAPLRVLNNSAVEEIPSTRWSGLL